MSNTGVSENPFVTHESIGERRLAGNPLELTFVQVQFSPIAAFDGFAERIVAALRPEYPIQTRVARQDFVLSDGEPMVQVTSGYAWLLRPVEPGISVTIAKDSVAFEFRAYPGRRKLLASLQHLVEVTAADADGPRAFTRLGVRNLNRFLNLTNEDLATKLRAPFLATSTISSGLSGVEQVVAVSEVHLVVQGATRIQARWGSLPPNASPLPGFLEPASTTSWFLDIDAYCDTPAAYDPETITSTASKVSTAGYHFFRWATLDDYVTSLIETEVAP